MASPGYLITVNWTDSSGPRSALYGIDVGMFPSVLGALNAAKSAVQTIQLAKAPASNATNFTASVSATR